MISLITGFIGFLFFMFTIMVGGVPAGGHDIGGKTFYFAGTLMCLIAMVVGLLIWCLDENEKEKSAITKKKDPVLPRKL